MPLKFDYDIGLMQKYMSEFRKIAGWTAEDFGERLGVTKQTISNFETEKVQLSRPQYIAIRTIFEAEMQMNHENATLAKIMDFVFSLSPELYNENVEAIDTAVISTASAASNGLKGLQLQYLATTLLLQFAKINHSSKLCSEHPSVEWLVTSLKEIEENKNESRN